MGQQETRQRRRKSPSSSCRYLIRLNLPQATWDDAWELCRSVEYYGGRATKEGFVFSSAARRTAALESLQDRFGKEYFQAIDVPDVGQGASLLVAERDEGRRHEQGRFLGWKTGV